MSDEVLFVVAPYLAALAFVPVCLVRYVLWSRQPARAAADLAGRGGSGLIAASGRWAIGLVALGHLVAFVFPSIILLWNQQPLRLLILEGAGLIAGIAALPALLARLVETLCAFDELGTPAPVDVIAGTLFLIDVLSGVAVAVLYRWGSSWSEVTLSPYLLSLLRLEPSTILVARLPWLVRLHVFSAFALLAVAPFTGPARFTFRRLDSLTRWSVVRGSNLIRPAWCAIEAWSTKRVQPLHAMMLGDDGEED